LVRNIQDWRKEKGLKISDRINLTVYTDSEFLLLAIKENEDYVYGGTLAVDPKIESFSDMPSLIEFPAAGVKILKMILDVEGEDVGIRIELFE